MVAGKENLKKNVVVKSKETKGSKPSVATTVVTKTTKRVNKIQANKLAVKLKKDLELVLSALRMVIIGKKSIYVVSQELGVNKDKLKRYLRVNDEASISNGLSDMRTLSRGRPERVPQPVLQKMRTRMFSDDMRGDSAVNVPAVRSSAKLHLPKAPEGRVANSFSSRLQEAVHEHALETSENGVPKMKQLKELSPSTVRKASKQLEVQPVVFFSGQNERRARALNDAYNFISLAAMALIQFSNMSTISITEIKAMSEAEICADPRFERNIDRRLIINIDKSSSKLGGEREKVKGMVAKGSAAKLNGKSLDPTYTKTGAEDGQMRSVGYTAVTDSYGGLVMFISHITDHSYSGTASDPKPMRLLKVSSFTYIFGIRVIYFVFIMLR